MTKSELDPVVRRAVDELSRLPAVPPASIARVVAAAAAARLTPADAPLIVPPPAPLRGRLLVAGAVAAGLIGVTLVGVHEVRARRATVPTSVAAVATPTSGSRDLRSVASVDPDVAPLPHQFVFQSVTARHISVVGDFNAWNPADAPMTRDANTNLWSITLPIAPGRHVYGFMIDDSVFALDPQEPKTRDPDLGTAGSVIIVGKP